MDRSAFQREDHSLITWRTTEAASLKTVGTEERKKEVSSQLGFLFGNYTHCLGRNIKRVQSE